MFQSNYWKREINFSIYTSRWKKNRLQLFSSTLSSTRKIHACPYSITETRSENKAQRTRTKWWNIYFNLRATAAFLCPSWGHLHSWGAEVHPFFFSLVDFCWMPYLIPDRHWISVTLTPQHKLSSSSSLGRPLWSHNSCSIWIHYLTEEELLTFVFASQQFPSHWLFSPHPSPNTRRSDEEGSQKAATQLVGSRITQSEKAKK